MMRYNPNRVTRVERQAFQLVGDKVENKLRKHEALTQQERDSYWRSAVRKAMTEVSYARA